MLAIQEFLRPTSTKAVKSFLRIVYRRHVKNMATVAHTITRKDKTTGRIVIFE